MTEQDVTPEQAMALIQEHHPGATITFKGAAPIEDTFNEVSKMDPPDYAWHVLVEVRSSEDEEDDECLWTYQIGEKDGKLGIYNVYDYSIFE